jgi:hypothetical protein
MKFKIAGNDTIYDAQAGVEKATLHQLYELKVKHGIGVKTLANMVHHMSKFEDPTDVLDDKDGFRALMIVIWLARRHAGEHTLSLEDATSFPISDLEMVEEEPPAEEAGDPKAPTDSDPAASVDPGAPTST